jgi:tRNA(Ile)-lysidine synthase
MNRKSSLTGWVERYIEGNRLFGPGSRIVVGVSGGPDSMALLSILNELRRPWDLELIALYCHHGLRPAADQEADFVRRRAELWDCSFATARVDVRTYQKERKMSLQEAARSLRYEVFQSFLEKHRAQKLALAHTANDQAEEVLIGLIRGAGLGGLSGMPLQRAAYVRPLLATYRREILTYLEERNIPYLKDESNNDLRFLRARIRHQLLPELRKFSPQILTQLNRTAGLLVKDESFLQEETGRIMARVLVPWESGVRFSRDALKAFHPAILSRLFQQSLLQVKGDLRRIRSVHLLTLTNLIHSSSRRGKSPLPGRVEASWDEDWIYIRPAISSILSRLAFSARIDRPGKVLIREIGAMISFDQVPVGPRTPRRTLDRRQVLVDWEKIQWPVLVRSLQSGDRFHPLGLKGSKKVTRFLMDRRVPRSQRDRIPIVLSGGEIVWIAGLEIGDPFALRDQSSQALRLRLDQE